MEFTLKDKRVIQADFTSIESLKSIGPADMAEIEVIVSSWLNNRELLFFKVLQLFSSVPYKPLSPK